MIRTMAHPLDNIFWNCLDGPHRHLSSGTDRARRYAPGFSPIVGFPDPQQPDFAALRPFCTPGEQFYCDVWSGPAPDGWRIEVDAKMFRLVWDGRPGPADAACCTVAGMRPMAFSTVGKLRLTVVPCPTWLSMFKSAPWRWATP